MRSYLSLVAVLGFGLSGCLGSEDASGRSGRAIIGGEETGDFPAVALIEVGQARCTATLVSETVMVTAAHCIYDAYVTGPIGGTAFFGPSRSEGDSVEIEDLIPHRLYRPQFVREADVGIVRLAEPPPGDIAPMAWNSEALDEALLGAGVTLVGFGVTDGEDQTGAGVKRMVDLTLDEVAGEQLLGIGDDLQNICQGDSGGPTILDIDGTLTVIAVSSFGSNFCQNRSFVTRTDVFSEFIDEVVQAWSGPCQNDLNCVTEGCGTFPDPDCGICGLEGVCGQDCPFQDLDCQPKGVPGELCDTDADCELGMCVDATEGPYRICSEACDSGSGGSDCSRNLDTCVGGVCQFSGIIPGTQGAECEEPADCASGICDTDHEICVEECDGSCPEPYSCEDVGPTRVCTFAQGGCCTLAPGGRGPSPWPGIWLAAVVMLFLWRVRSKVR